MRDRRPLAIQVRDGIRDYLLDHELQPGDRLPSEADLASHFEVGRTTIREALKGLEEQGLIDVQRGLGRFVAAASALRVQRPVTRFESVTEMMEGLGFSVSNRVLRIEETPAEGEVAALLGIDEGATTVRLERLRLDGDEALIYSVNVLDRAALPDHLEEADWRGSIVALLERNGQHIVSSAARISATVLPPDAREHFALPPDAPWLLVEETCITDTGRRVLLAWDYHRADTFAFHVLRRRDS